MSTTAYRPGAARRFNLTTKKNGIRRPATGYAISRPYTPASLPNISSALYSRYNVGREWKYFHTHQPINNTFNVNGNLLPFSPAGFFIPLLVRQSAEATLHFIKQGGGASERVGNKITIKRVKIRGSLDLGSHSSNKHGGRLRYRIMVVQDLQANGITLVPASHTAQLLFAANIDAPLNPIYSSKFKVHWDKTFSPNLYPNGITNNENSEYLFAAKSMPIDVTIKSSIPLTYQGVDGQLNELVNNNLYVFIIAELKAADDNAIGKDRVTPNLMYQAMIYYEDIQ